MKIIDYMEQLEEEAADLETKSGIPLSEYMFENTNIWSNKACKGYIIEAMRAASLSDGKIKDVLEQLEMMFEEIDVDEAEEIADNFR